MQDYYRSQILHFTPKSSEREAGKGSLKMERVGMESLTAAEWDQLKE